MKNDNGGPAFPVNESNYENCGDTGMTLRDYFAGKAITGILNIALHSEEIWLCDDIAKEVYKMADAIISERNKLENKNV